MQVPLGVLAVGNCDVMTAHKDGTSPVHTTTNTFFGNTGDAGSDGDIIAYYDNQYGRFVTIAFATDASTYSHMVVAISKTNDATGAWWKYQFDWTIDGTTPTGNFADFEKVGVSADKFVISSQQFVMSSTAANRVYMYQKLRVFDRATMYSGGTATFVDFVNYPGQQFVTIPAKELSADSTIYLMADETAGGNSLYYGTLTGPSNNPTLVAGLPVAVQSYGPTLGTANGGGFVFGGSSAYRVADGDCRLNNFFFRNGNVHLVFHAGVVISPDTVDAIKYVELNTKTNPWSVVRDELYSTPSFWWYYPSIGIDSAGTVFIGSDGSSKSVYPSFYVTGQRRNESSFESFTQSKAGTATPATSESRWGDYTAGQVDESATSPSGATAWFAGQYAPSTTTPGQWVQSLFYPYDQISGQVLSDADGNEGTTGDRTPLVGWTVQAMQGSNVIGSAVTDASGNYNLGYLEDGTYNIVVSYLNNRRIALDVIPGSGGTSQTKIDTATIQVHVTMSTSAGQTSSGNIFLLKPNTATISGNIFNDLNGNGVQDLGESALTGWTVNLTGTSSASTTTDGSGNYSFTGLLTGSYTVSDVIQSGYAATVPVSGSYNITIAASDSQVTGITFGNFANTTMTWTGAGGDGNWNTPTNWNPNGIPTSSNPVAINNPSTITINVAAQCGGFTLGNSGAVITIQSGQSLSVTGNFLMNSGTFNTQGAFPTVSGTTTLNGGTVGYTATSGSQTVTPLSYVNLQVSGGGTSTLGIGTTTVSGNLSIASGSTLNLSGKTLTPGGSATLTVGAGSTIQTGGTSLAGFSSYSINSTSTVQYNGAAENILAQTYGNLSASGSDVKTLLGNATVNGVLSLGQQITTGSYTLTMGSSGTVSQTTGFVYGRLAKQVSSIGLTTWELGIPGTYLPASLNVSALSGSGVITLRSVASNAASSYAGDPTKAIGHYYTVTLGSGITSITAIPAYDYSLSEFNTLTGTGGDQTKLFLARWNGQAWVSLRTTSYDSVQASGGNPGMVTLTSGVSSFSPWGIFWGTTDAPLTSSGTALTLRTWIGSGSGGSGTDFNNASNWSPTGTPTSQDSCYINCTVAGNINLSDDITIGALTVIQQTNGTSGFVYIDAQSHALTINGKQTGICRSASTTTGVFLCVEAGGSWVNNGNVYDSCSAVGSGLTPWFSQTSNPTGAFIFRGTNLVLQRGEFSYTGANVPPIFIFDGTGTQNVIDSASYTTYIGGVNVIVGQLNNPTVLFGGDANLLATFGNITINGSSVLDLASKAFSRAGSLGIITINGTGKLRTSGVFPANFSTFNYSGTDTTEFYSSSAQAVPAYTYGNLLITNADENCSFRNHDDQYCLNYPKRCDIFWVNHPYDQSPRESDQ